MTAAPRVLIVDDRDVVRDTLRDILEDFACSFTEVAKGGPALDILSVQSFDIVFLDLRLPDISGLEVLRELRKSAIVQGKVIILTGQPDPATKTEAESLGAFRYLTKPLERGAIREAFTAALSGSEAPFEVLEPEPKSEPKIAVRAKRRTRGSAVRRSGTDQRPYLLVLDDDPSWLDTLQQKLGREFDLTLTTSAREACRRARKEPFDLVVLDKQLPEGVTGLDVLSQMRRARPDLRALILTGFPDLKSANESGRRGAVDYVSKGELATLSERVRELLKTKRQPFKVFLSYARKDKTRVSDLYYRLLGRGFLPWMDIKNIKAGKWRPKIIEAIDKVDKFVFFLSRHSVEREGTIREELQQALERQGKMLPGSVFLIPARLEDVEVERELRPFHYIDLFRRGGFEHLVEALSSNGEHQAP